jgi:hypothetical protein
MTAAHDDPPTVDETGDAFDELGHRAGEALRAPADRAALRRVMARGRRQQTAHRVAVVGAAGGLVVAVLVGTVIVRDEASPPSDQPQPTISASTLPTSTVPTTAAATTTAGVADGQAWIAHVRDTGDGFRVHLVRPDGTGLHPLGGLPADSGSNHPEWSPDGGRLLVVATGRTTDIWMVDADGSNGRAVVECDTPCVWADEPSWSADGRRIAFQRLVDTGAGILSTVEVLDLDSSTIDVVAVAPPRTMYAAPDWSPDNASLVVEVVELADLSSADIAVESTGSALGIIELATPDAEVRMITALDRFASNPDWSPVGDLIVFAERAETSSDATDLFTIAPDGTGRSALTDHAAGTGSATFATFEPSGRRVVYSLTGSSGRDVVMTVSIDGSDRKPATDGDSLGMQPALRPT